MFGKKIKKIFQKPLDKRLRLWYNKYRKREEQKPQKKRKREMKMKMRECYVFANKVTNNKMYYPTCSYTESRARMDLIEYDIEHLNDWEYQGVKMVETF